MSDTVGAAPLMEGYMHVAEAARELGLTRRAVLARIERGDMKAERIHPKLWVIPVAEVDRWRELGRLKPGPKPKAEE
jgi:excisionase family DNA binding protein